MQHLAIFCLSAVAMLCAIGALHPRFEDNTLQRIGMGVVCVASVSLAEQCTRGPIPVACGLMSIGLFAYSAGVAFKVARRHKPMRFPTITG